MKNVIEIESYENIPEYVGIKNTGSITVKDGYEWHGHSYGICVGIIYDELHGGVQEDTYNEGFHTKSIFEHITTISTANRSALVNTTGQTNDGQYATFELSIIYKIKQTL